MNGIRKKLVEVALPPGAINKAAAWAVIFAQMVDDPASHPDIFKTEKAQERERQSLEATNKEVRWFRARRSAEQGIPSGRLCESRKGGDAMEKHVRKRDGHGSNVTALVVVGWVSFILSHHFDDTVVTMLFSAIARVLP